MSASRVEAVETKPQTAPPRWKTEGDDYKADLTAHPEEIKELCPIVITTIAAAPTRFNHSLHSFNVASPFPRATVTRPDHAATHVGDFAGAARGSSTTAILTGCALSSSALRVRVQHF